ncbi:putative heme-binding uptake, Tiki superfamily, ChaN [Helianthus annuus]|nr:putative heme-binding uptake, Tiki superfamily, ChaN [Helianthus annuus]KAJ0729835.1 putative heme-binding uptake, Tiki superfamily, ChaN [Helianthus annuus]KAJ0732576.1 putative heme-binding uptake, Tiki superfamily, ChaN [Helianthus annuus]KAJ0906221.1 putative heme-binding uptake, Tiki superfamily, ChaN [Helianthus annuus]
MEAHTLRRFHSLNNNAHIDTHHHTLPPVRVIHALSSPETSHHTFRVVPSSKRHRHVSISTVHRRNPDEECLRRRCHVSIGAVHRRNSEESSNGRCHVSISAVQRRIPEEESSSARRHVSCSGVNRRKPEEEESDDAGYARRRRRDVLVMPLVAIGASVLRSAVARAEEKAETATVTETNTAIAPVKEVKTEAVPTEKVEVKKEEVITSRIYDATVIGEPMAVGKDKGKVWEKLMNGRIVYLGEAEQVPTRDDKELEVEIVRSLAKRCAEANRRITLALEAFPADLQEQLNQFIDKRIDGEALKPFVSYWPAQRWQEYEPLLNYCRDNGVRLVACGTPLKVLRTVQADGIRGLSKAERKAYAPPAGSGFISGFTSISRRPLKEYNFPNQSIPFGPSSYLSAQTRVIEEYTMSQIILQAVTNGEPTGLLVVVTGASHVAYGSRGTGVPARIAKKMQKKNQTVILLDPERQYIRREGEVPVADFLWYSAARPCTRNCFDRAEIARVMNAAGRKRDALPQDIQKGLDLGLVSPEVLQNFFDLEQYPLLSELTHNFQGFRERLLADPKFLNRLAIEESISITTTLIAQYQKRKGKFFEEIDYVMTDTIRGIVVDFFTVWLPAPTLSFLSFADDANGPDSIDALTGLLGSIPDNAFQKALAGKDWDVGHRVASVVVGGVKLAGVGFISSIGAVAVSNVLYTARKFLNPTLVNTQQVKRSPIMKTAVVYSSFLGTSANLRYQIIAGLVEHRLSDMFADQTLFVNMISFVSRTINSYWGTQQWIDLARFTGLQAQKSEPPTNQTIEAANPATVGCNTTEEANVDEIENQQSMR